MHAWQWIAVVSARRCRAVPASSMSERKISREHALFHLFNGSYHLHTYIILYRKWCVWSLYRRCRRCRFYSTLTLCRMQIRQQIFTRTEYRHLPGFAHQFLLSVILVSQLFISQSGWDTCRIERHVLLCWIHKILPRLYNEGIRGVHGKLSAWLPQHFCRTFQSIAAKTSIKHTEYKSKNRTTENSDCQFAAAADR